MAQTQTSDHRRAHRRSWWFPDRLIGDLLGIRWMDNAIPFGALLIVVLALQILLPGFFSIGMVTELSRQFAETGLIVLALTIVIIGGGIDVSIGAVFGLAVLLAVICMNVLGLSVGVTLVAVILLGVVCGGINGLLVGYLRLRAFLTTLVTLIIFRSIYELVFPKYSTEIIVNTPDSRLWDFLGFGALGAVPVTFVVAVMIVLAWHIVMTRMRPGWRIIAVGSARRSAHNMGINVRRTVFGTYVWSGIMCSIAGFFSAARLGGAGTDTGVGIEITALTAVVLGGIALGGGRGSVAKAVMGTVIVLLLTNGLIALSVPGAMSSTILGIVLLAAVFLDTWWARFLQRASQKVRIAPAAAHLPATVPDIDDAKVHTLGAAERVGVGIAAGAADVAFGPNGDLYFGNNRGEILRCAAPNLDRPEVFSHVGGHPRGLAFDADGNLMVAISGMGLYRVSPDGKADKLVDRINRSRLSINDESRIRFANGLSVGANGQVILSDATCRFEAHQWMAEAMEGRPNGRLLLYRPDQDRLELLLDGLYFPSGVCLEPDGQSVLFAERFGCRISRYHFDGSKKGLLEPIIDGTPGYPGMIHPASDGGYWVALEGARTPFWNLVMAAPQFRKRLVRDCSPDLWPAPNLNGGQVLKITGTGDILARYVSADDRAYSKISAAAERDGMLFIAGERNGLVGRHVLAQQASRLAGQLRAGGRG